MFVIRAHCMTTNWLPKCVVKMVGKGSVGPASSNNNKEGGGMTSNPTSSPSSPSSPSKAARRKVADDPPTFSAKTSFEANSSIIMPAYARDEETQ